MARTHRKKGKDADNATGRWRSRWRRKRRQSRGRHRGQELRRWQRHVHRRQLRRQAHGWHARRPQRALPRRTDTVRPPARATPSAAGTVFVSVHCSGAAAKAVCVAGQRRLRPGSGVAPPRTVELDADAGIDLGQFEGASTHIAGAARRRQARGRSNWAKTCPGSTAIARRGIAAPKPATKRVATALACARATATVAKSGCLRARNLWFGRRCREAPCSADTRIGRERRKGLGLRRSGREEGLPCARRATRCRQAWEK